MVERPRIHSFPPRRRIIHDTGLVDGLILFGAHECYLSWWDLARSMVDKERPAT